MKKQYKYLLFDLDGTLTDPKEGITRCVQYALQSFGIEVKSLDELICFIGPPLRESFQNFYGMSEADAEKAVEKYRERFSAVGKFENSVLPGIIPMLKKLKEAGKIMALSTSKPWVFAEQILKKYELDSYFSVVVGSELDGTRDEKQEVILETLKRFGLEKGSKEAVMIGDRRHDILGAKKCGLDGIGVRFGYAEEGELEKAGAVMIADTVEELQRICLLYTSEKGEEQIKKQIAYYMRNANVILEGLKNIGFKVSGGVNAPYIWLKTPDQMTSWQFFDFLLEKANVVGTPGSGFGPGGEGYFRLTGFGTYENTVEAIERIKRSF